MRTNNMRRNNSTKTAELRQRRDVPLAVRTDLTRSATKDIAGAMNAMLADDNQTLAARLREAHNVCDEHRDVATASLIEVWIDETERRTWFLSEIKRGRQH